MSNLTITPQKADVSTFQQRVECKIDDLLASLPDPQQINAEARGGIIARYTAVLEGNFIYWMTAANLATRSEEAHEIILENLTEEVRDSHPEMMRRFAMAANAYPTDKDAFTVHDELTAMRLFLGRLRGVQTVLTMAFFEGFIQKFMPYLAELAALQGSSEMEYTDVHGVCDIEHTAGLYRALASEMAVNPMKPEADIFEGVNLLATLLQVIIHKQARAMAA
jgi:hypothetical protein